MPMLASGLQTKLLHSCVMLLEEAGPCWSGLCHWDCLLHIRMRPTIRQLSGSFRPPWWKEAPAAGLTGHTGLAHRACPARSAANQGHDPKLNQSPSPEGDLRLPERPCHSQESGMPAVQICHVLWRQQGIQILSVHTLLQDP